MNRATASVKTAGSFAAATKSASSSHVWSSPITYWSAFGVATFTLLSYVILGWIFSNDFRPVPVGTDPLPAWEQFWVMPLQIIFPAIALACIGIVVRGCIKERRFTFDGKLWIGCFLMFWLDPGPNFFRTQVMFNGHYVNMGSWVEHYPGWMSANGANLPDALLVEIPIFGFLIAAVWLACWLMGKARERFPKAPAAALLLLSWVWLVVFTFILEWVALIKTGWLVWNGTIPELSLWAGTRFQMPLTEMAIVALWLTILAGLRFYRDDKGSSFIEKGLDKMDISHRAKQLLSTMAIIGYCQMSFMVYNLLSMPLAFYIGPTPAGLPSYIRNGMCGDGTPYQCPGPGVPLIIPRPANTTTG